MSGSASGATGESEIEIYAALIEDMKKAMDGLDKTSDLYKTYAAQLKVLEDYQTSLNQNAVSGMQQAMAMLSQLDDAGVHAAQAGEERLRSAGARCTDHADYH